MRFEVGVCIVTVEPKGRIGSAFDDFLKEKGIFEEVQANALEKVVAHQLGEPESAIKYCDSATSIPEI